MVSCMALFFFVWWTFLQNVVQQIAFTIWQHTGFDVETRTLTWYNVVLCWISMTTTCSSPHFKWSKAALQFFKIEIIKICQVPTMARQYLSHCMWIALCVWIRDSLNFYIKYESSEFQKQKQKTISRIMTNGQ